MRRDTETARRPRDLVGNLITESTNLGDHTARPRRRCAWCLPVPSLSNIFARLVHLLAIQDNFRRELARESDTPRPPPLTLPLYTTWEICADTFDIWEDDQDRDSHYCPCEK